MGFRFLIAVHTNSGRYWLAFSVISFFLFKKIVLISNITIEFHLYYFEEFPTIHPFTVGIWCGEGKPNVNEFLRKFVDELKIILNTGIAIKNFVIRIKIKCFICDTPARAFIKGVYNKPLIITNLIELIFFYSIFECLR